MTDHTKPVSVRVPASTSNLGAGFDCFGLALQLYLTVTAQTTADGSAACSIQAANGRHNAGLSCSSNNLIYRAMTFIAERERDTLPPLFLQIDNCIPVSRGLGGSAAAIIAGVKLYSSLCERQLSNEQLLKYAAELEGHADNAAPSLLGGFVVNCTDSSTGEVISLKTSWPADVKVIVVVPEVTLDTKVARAALPDTVPHGDAVFNLQRAALFVTALMERRYDLLWTAMRDRLHQQQRRTLAPGLAEVLATPRVDGLLGVALSGAGPSVVALAEGNFEQIKRLLSAGFARHSVECEVLQLEIDNEGCAQMFD